VEDIIRVVIAGMLEVKENLVQAFVLLTEAMLVPVKKTIIHLVMYVATSRPGEDAAGRQKAIYPVGILVDQINVCIVEQAIAETVILHGGTQRGCVPVRIKAHWSSI
jgi:hypothetical protein